jgi:hypothetical protein
MKLRVETVTRKNKDFKRVKELLITSFPKEQLLPLWLLLLSAKAKETDFLSFYDEEVLCGFAYVTTIGDISFVVYLAILPSMRSKGYGSAILNKIQSMHKAHKMLLYIDRCDEKALDYEKCLKRKQFYIKNGYMETGYLVETRKVIQEILIKNGVFDKEEFIKFNGLIKPKLFKIKE